MRCVGKTTLGRAVAERMNVSFSDTDVYFEQKYGSTPGAYITQYGLQSFREAEHLCVRGIIDACQVHSTQVSVVSTGGGVLVENKNRELLSHYATIFLWSPLRVLVERMLRDTTRRPMLTDASSVEEEYAMLWQQRQSLYMRGTYFLNVYMDRARAIMKLEDCIRMLLSS